MCFFSRFFFRSWGASVGGDDQAVLDSEQGRVVGAAINEIINGVRRGKFNRFVPQAYLPLSNLPPPKVRTADSREMDRYII